MDGRRSRIRRPDADERLTAGLAKNIRVHELAKELGMTNKEMLDLCDGAGGRREESLVDASSRPRPTVFVVALSVRV